MTLLVVTTVHHPDDNRIREKTIRALARRFAVTFAARAPGPSDDTELTWIPLSGGRLRRNITAWKVAFRGRYDVASLHDPELLPLGIALALTRRSHVVFDVHEDIPAQMRTKEWLPRWSRAPVAASLVVLLRLAERLFELTLAEESYARVLKGVHPVIANYPDTADLPLASGETSGVIYVGDVSVARGVLDAVAACGDIGLPLTLVGPGSLETEERIWRTAARHKTDVEILGRLPHREAMAHVAGASVALCPLHDLPNYRESVPTKILEYLAVGVPVAASDLPATRRLVDGLDSVVLHPPGDIEALGAAVVSLTSSDAALRAREQVSLVRERFSWQADDLIDVYERISSQ